MSANKPKHKPTYSGERAAVISDCIGSVILKDFCQINVVAGQGFKDLMTYLEP